MNRWAEGGDDGAEVARVCWNRATPQWVTIM